MVLDGLQQVVGVDVFEPFLPDGHFVVFFAEGVHSEPQLVGVRGVTENYVQETYGRLLLPLGVLVVGVASVGLVFDAHLHVQTEEVFHASGGQLGLQDPPEPC